MLIIKIIRSLPFNRLWAQVANFHITHKSTLSFRSVSLKNKLQIISSRENSSDLHLIQRKLKSFSSGEIKYERATERDQRYHEVPNKAINDRDILFLVFKSEINAEGQMIVADCTTAEKMLAEATARNRYIQRKDQPLTTILLAIKDSCIAAVINIEGPERGLGKPQGHARRRFQGPHRSLYYLTTKHQNEIHREDHGFCESN